MTAVAYRPDALTVVLAGLRPSRPSRSSTPTGLGYPPPSAYPALPLPRGAALAPAGLAAPLPGPVVTPWPSTGFPALDRALVRSRWVLGDEPATGGGHRAARGR